MEHYWINIKTNDKIPWGKYYKLECVITGRYKEKISLLKCSNEVLLWNHAQAPGDIWAPPFLYHLNLLGLTKCYWYLFWMHYFINNLQINMDILLNHKLKNNIFFYWNKMKIYMNIVHLIMSMTNLFNNFMDGWPWYIQMGNQYQHGGPANRVMRDPAVYTFHMINSKIVVTLIFAATTVSQCELKSIDWNSTND